jgi:two-component system, chemotaxis family, sensor kinase Cph1
LNGAVRTIFLFAFIYQDRPMNSITEFFKGILRTDLWPARWHCGFWTDFHGWLYIISDLLIWLAYFMIPVIIFSYVSKRKQVIKYSAIYLLFAAFILLCGTTHFLDAVMFWVPMYRLNALVRFVTAIISLLTVYYLFKIIPEAFKGKTSIELEREISRREHAEIRLAVANKSLESFASIASHDLQEPLRKIKTFSSMLYEMNEENFSPESRELANKILNSTDRMQLLVKDVLTLSTISDEIEFNTVEIREVISTVMDDLEIKISEKNVRIDVGEIPLVRGNKSYLTQLFLNLISNAIKFNLRAPVISIQGKTIGSRVYVDVTDNGIGIEKEHLSRIFDAFYRLNAKQQFEGSGIGLTICKKIVAVHNGNIKADSKPGEGTTFTVDLPSAL